MTLETPWPWKDGSWNILSGKPLIWLNLALNCFPLAKSTLWESHPWHSQTWSGWCCKNKKKKLFLFNKIVTRCPQDVDKLPTSSTDVQSGIFMVEGPSVSLKLQKGSDAFWQSQFWPIYMSNKGHLSRCRINDHSASAPVKPEVLHSVFMWILLSPTQVSTFLSIFHTGCVTQEQTENKNP